MEIYLFLSVTWICSLEITSIEYPWTSVWRRSVVLGGSGEVICEYRIWKKKTIFSEHSSIFGEANSKDLKRGFHITLKILYSSTVKRIQQQFDEIQETELSAPFGPADRFDNKFRKSSLKCFCRYCFELLLCFMDICQMA